MLALIIKVADGRRAGECTLVHELLVVLSTGGRGTPGTEVGVN